MRVERFSLYELLPDLAPIEVIDVGAGQMRDDLPLYYHLARAGGARITGYEPNLNNCVALNQRYGRPHRFFPHFVGDGGVAKFYQTNSPFTGSLFLPNRPLLDLFSDVGAVTQLVAVEDVQTVRLDDNPDIADVDFLKLDVQGSELAILRGAETALAAAVVVQTEVCFVELYQGQPLFADLDAHLRSRGFAFQHLEPFGTATVKPPLPVAVGHGDPGRIQQLWSDALYIKDLLRLEQLGDDKLRKLAVILHDLYGICDIAHHCLEIVDRRGGTDVAPRYAALIAPAG